ncbi:MAG TPA: DnaJ domain-containing protein [Stellaceae bacterium]|nr:DnaJ domain-containing protein [Stellaceae bacterium]
MPLYLVGGILLLVLLLAAGRAFVALPPAVIVRFLMWLGVFAAIAVAVLLIESGRFLPVVIALGGAAPFLARAKTVWRRWAGGGGGPRGQVSEVETDYLRMSLDHETGTMTGTVRKGRFQGRRLEELDNASLIALWREVRAEDPPSVSLVESYLDRFMPDWREAAKEAGGSEGTSHAAGTAMTPDEALAILGLKRGAGAAEIKEAHHRLMMKIHPDQGGSDALAAQVNRAKDVLLGT